MSTLESNSAPWGTPVEAAEFPTYPLYGLQEISNQI